jgi:hypothetical protein
MMYEAKPIGPKRRAFFIAGLSVGLLLLGWADYGRMTHKPAPRWTEDLSMAFMTGLWALYILLCPVRGMTRTMAIWFVALLALFCATDLFFLVKG